MTITNSAATPVNPPSPFIFDMPKAAGSATVLEGSSPQASAAGTRVRVEGPFAPGDTVVQVACSLPVTSGSMDISQRFPATLEQLDVVVRKVGNLTLVSKQVDRQQEIPANGEVAIIGEGGTIWPQPSSCHISGPAAPQHRAAVDRADAGVRHCARRELADGAARGSRARGVERKQPIARRELLQSQYSENDQRLNRGDRARSAQRREELLAGLEQVYGALDTDEANVEPASKDRSGFSAQPRHLGPLGAS